MLSISDWIGIAYHGHLLLETATFVDKYKERETAEASFFAHSMRNVSIALMVGLWRVASSIFYGRVKPTSILTSTETAMIWTAMIWTAPPRKSQRENETMAQECTSRHISSLSFFTLFVVCSLLALAQVQGRWRL